VTDVRHTRDGRDPGIRFRLVPLPDKDRSFLAKLGEYPRGTDLLTDGLRWIGSWLLVALMRLQYRIEVEGTLPDADRIAMAANHQSHLDALAVMATLPGRRRRELAVLAAADYFFRGRVGTRIAASVFAAAVAFDRTRASELRTWSRRLQSVSRGTILFFPSGSRRHRDAQRGMLVVMARSEWPIVPVRIYGTAEAWPVGRRWWRPFRRLRVTYGAPLDEDAATDLAGALDGFWREGDPT
jgi:1-acyl-sn-glycerol-3-phosphate acyltransferase